MRQRMKNYLSIAVNGVDLTTVSNIEFYLRQSSLFFQYTPKIVSAEEMLVEIPYEDAMKLASGECRIQFAYTDIGGTPLATDVKNVSVGTLLKEAGYAPV